MIIIITLHVTFNITLGHSLMTGMIALGHSLVTGIVMPIVARFVYDRFIAPKK